MKILQVVSFFKPSWEAGGITRVCYEISRELQKKGNDVTVYTTDGFKHRLPVVNGKPVSVDELTVYYFKNLSNLLAKRNICLPYALPFVAKKELKKIDIIHIHSFRGLLTLPICYYAKKYNVPYIIQAHGSLPRISEKQALKKLYDTFWGNDILKCASKVVAVSKSELEQLRQAGIPDEKITVIPNGVNYVSSTSLPPSGQFREQYGIHEKHIILYVGRIHKIKGIDFLIRAFNSFILTWTGDDVVLVIGGPDDGYRSVLENLVEQLGLSGRVRFVDFISTVEAAYQDADVLVYPSTYEIFGLVPFEALLCGTPVIVTDDCGCGELIKEAECGYLVHYGDVAGLSETLRSALEHPDVNRRMVEAGRRYIEEHLAWESVVKQVEAMYEGCVRHV